MTTLKITPAKLNGSVCVPSSKSMGHREIICAGLSEGGGGEPDLYLRFVGTWDGYPVRERWGVCTEMITLFRLEST